MLGDALKLCGTAASEYKHIHRFHLNYRLPLAQNLARAIDVSHSMDRPNQISAMLLICNALLLIYRMYPDLPALLLHNFVGNIRELNPQCTANWPTWRISDFV